MPKLKTNKAAAKRYKQTASGKFKRTKANRRHLLANKTKRQKMTSRVQDGIADKSCEKTIKKVENFRKPMLWDADALNLLAINPDKRHNRVITPHPGEAARLLGCSVAEIESDRLHCAKRLVQRYGGVAVLKGAGTVVAAHPDALGIIDAGNAGMASGGMGDVLSGIIGALLGQKLSPYDAACAGCVAHGAAADVLAARFGTRGMLATDLFSTLQRIVNPEVTDKNHDESSNSAP